MNGRRLLLQEARGSVGSQPMGREDVAAPPRGLGMIGSSLKRSLQRSIESEVTIPLPDRPAGRSSTLDNVGDITLRKPSEGISPLGLQT